VVVLSATVANTTDIYWSVGVSFLEESSFGRTISTKTKHTIQS